LLQHESALRQPDGRRHHRRALHRAVPGERQLEAGDVAGYGGGEIPLGAQAAEDVAVAIEVHVWGSGERSRFAEIDDRLAAVGELDRHEAAAADVARRWEDDAERVADADRRVDRVAATLQDVDADPRGEMLARHHHAVARADGRSRRRVCARAADEHREREQQSAGRAAAPPRVTWCAEWLVSKATALHRFARHGATVAPSMPCLARDWATNPEDFIVFTNSIRYWFPATRDRGVPIAWLITMNRPSSTRRPGRRFASASSCCLTPAATSSFRATKKSATSGDVGARTIVACFNSRER
jgi:hypothetical protein